MTKRQIYVNVSVGLMQSICQIFAKRKRMSINICAMCIIMQCCKKSINAEFITSATQQKQTKKQKQKNNKNITASCIIHTHINLKI